MSAVVHLPEEPNEEERQAALTDAYLKQLHEEHEQPRREAMAEVALKFALLLAVAWGVWVTWQLF